MKTLSSRSILCLQVLFLVSLSSVLFGQESRAPKSEVPGAAIATQDLSQPTPSMQGVPRATLPDYSLSPGDLIEVKVFQEDDLESKLRISDEGTITFPLIGVVRIGGMTAQAASQVIRNALRRYLVNPQVTLIVSEYSKRRFTVLGQVQQPGSYEMPDRDPLTLLQAIGMAGGYTRIADPSKIVLKRVSSSGGDEVIKINASRMAKDNSISSIQVQPGDVITVRESIF